MEGTAQAKIAAGGYADSPLLANITGGTNTNIEFGTGTVAKPKLEQGVIATDYVCGGFSEELAKCLRFYQKTYDYAVASGTVTSNGAIVECAARNAAAKTAGLMFQCPMAATPTVVLYSPVTGTSGNIDNDGDKAATAASMGEKGIGYVSVPSGVTTSDASYHMVLKTEL